MQQPPSGRPPRPPGGAPPPGTPPQGGRAPAPGNYPPPGGWGQPAQQAPSSYAPPRVEAPPPALGVTPPKRKSRGSLKFLASTCVFSAWITLVLSVFSAFSTFMFAAGFGTMAGSMGASPSGSLTAPANPSLSSPGDDGLGISKPSIPGIGNLGSAMGGAMLGQIVGPVCFAFGAFTLVSGIVTFIIFLGLGQACYVLIDLEEQSIQQGEALGIIIARLGQGR